MFRSIEKILPPISTTLTGLVFWDFPFGIQREAWDQEPLSEADLKSILYKLFSLHDWPWFKFVCCVRWDLVSGYKKVFNDVGIKRVTPWIWYKEDQNQEHASTLQALEFLLVAHFEADDRTGERVWPATGYNNAFLNPLNRHNHLQFKGVSKRLTDSNDEVVNQHEKPPQLLFSFTQRYHQRGTNILVIGGGCGGDVIGAIKSDAQDVIVVEPDEYQFKHMVRRVETLLGGDSKNRDLAFLGITFPIVAKSTATTEAEQEVESIQCVACGGDIQGATFDKCVTCNAVFCTPKDVDQTEVCFVLGGGVRYCSPTCVPQDLTTEE